MLFLCVRSEQYIMGAAFQVFKYMPLSLVIEPTQLVVVPRTILLYEIFLVCI